jgi:hypothetical protein
LESGLAIRFADIRPPSLGGEWPAIPQFRVASLQPIPASALATTTVSQDTAFVRVLAAGNTGPRIALFLSDQALLVELARVIASAPARL